MTGFRNTFWAVLSGICQWRSFRHLAWADRFKHAAMHFDAKTRRNG